MTALVVSEARVPVAPFQQVSGTDLTAAGTFPQGSLDNVVENILIAGVGYVGMGASQVGTSNIVAIQPGYLIKGGPAFSLRDAFNVDVSAAINSVPDNTKNALVAIVADGQEFPVQATRTFVDASKLPTDPTTPAPTVTQATPTQIVRSVVISSPAGTPNVGSAAVLPSFSANLCLIAIVAVSNTAIVSVSQNTATQITRLDQIVPVVSGLSASVAGLQGLLAGLLSSVSANTLAIAALKAQFLAAIANLQSQNNALQTQSTSSPTSIFRVSDFFQDLSQSNPTASGYNAVVSSGLRFSTAAHFDIAFTPSQPNVANFTETSGFIGFPSFQLTSNDGVLYDNRTLAGASSGYTVTVATQGSIGTTTGLLRGFSRIRTRMSQALQVGSAAQVLSAVDPTALFAIDPTTFAYDTTDWGNWQAAGPDINHLNGYWQDSASRGYWTPTTPFQFSGQIVAQPYTPSYGVMINDISFFVIGNFVNTIVNLNNGTLLICADNNGVPDFNHIFANTPILETAGPITGAPAGSGCGYCVGTFATPVYVAGGSKVHFVVVNSGAQYATAKPTDPYIVAGGSPGVANGTLLANPTAVSNNYLAYLNNQWVAPAPGYAMQMTVGTCSFPNTQVRVPLPPIQVIGGVDLLDMLAVGLMPLGTSIGYEVYNNGVYVPFAPGNAPLALAGNPNNVPINLVFNCTQKLAPIIDFTPGRSMGRGSRQALALDHVSSVQTPAANVTKIHKNVVVDQWVGGSAQTLTADLRTGTGYGTIVPPDATPVDVVQADGSLLRTWTWTLGTSVPSFETELIGSATSSSQAFVVRQSQWDAG